LSITRKLVELYDGNIDAESAAGVGTTFEVWFPQAKDV
ncbi:MAG: HAMP domain-containing histidine kinase, partial [Shimia sp.]|nr:HAMP domain-containing histidine kinase [Shimia sp.]